MTWAQLAAEIAKMTPQQRKREAIFVEPYDEDRMACSVQVVYATEDIYAGPGDGDELVVRTGRPMLGC